MQKDELTALQALLAKMTAARLIVVDRDDDYSLDVEGVDATIGHMLNKDDAAGIVALVNAAPALLASAARAAELEAEVAG